MKMLGDDVFAMDNQNVTVRHLLQMTSGIKWSEDYSGKQDSDVPKLYSAIFKGTPTIKELAMGVRNEVPPGTAHNYQSLNTFVLGLILEAATKTPFHVYTSRKHLFRASNVFPVVRWIRLVG